MPYNNVKKTKKNTKKSVKKYAKKTNYSIQRKFNSQVKMQVMQQLKQQRKDSNMYHPYNSMTPYERATWHLTRGQKLINTNLTEELYQQVLLDLSKTI